MGGFDPLPHFGRPPPGRFPTAEVLALQIISFDYLDLVITGPI